MRRPDHETASFGGKLCVRSGFKWVAATPADLERIEADRAARRDAGWWIAATSLLTLAALVAALRELL